MHGAPDVIFACCGDVPTTETMTDLKVQVINSADLMRLQSESQHPHGLSDSAFDAFSPASCPTIFAFHGYPWLIHRLTY